MAPTRAISQPTRKSTQRQAGAGLSGNRYTTTDSGRSDLTHTQLLQTVLI